MTTIIRSVVAHDQQQFDSTASPGGARSELHVAGMDCPHCARQVTEALQRVPGVASAAVSLETQRASVRWRPEAKADPTALVSAVRAAGYEAHAPEPVAAPSDRTEFIVEGMTCQHCVAKISAAIASVPGVAQAHVSLENHRAGVRWAAGAPPDVGSVLRAIQAAGYPARLAEAVPTARGDHTAVKASGWRTTLLVGLAGTLPLMVGEWLLGWSDQAWFRWVSFGLATLVQVVAGARFYRGAWNQLKVGTSNMDTLVSLGSTTAFVYSTWALLSGQGGHLYFMEAAAIITLISLGHWLEARMAARASSSLRALMNLAPPTARRRSAEGAEIEVPVAALRPDDRVVLRPGDRVPTDGVVVEGGAPVDESMLTGESAPVEKNPGDLVYAGTVNLSGRMVARVTATGEATALAHIIEAVQRAQSSRAHIQRLGDRVSNVFVPVVVLIALGTAAWWALLPEQAHAVADLLSRYLWPAHIADNPLAAAAIAAAAVLIIACPCAMGLATPAAIMAASDAAATHGILIRDGVSLEKAGAVTTVVFDKTGTLTVGKPEVAAWRAFPADGSSPEAALALAASLAAHSSHPFSQAVARTAEARVPLAEWQELRGLGLQARTAEAAASTVRLGSIKWFQDAGVDVSVAQSFLDQWTGQGASVIALAQENRLRAVFALGDTLKTGAAEAVAHLQRQGLKIVLLTGDRRATALALARQVNIKPEEVFAEVRPEQKAGFVQQIQQRGERVAFVGDGINDAPALEQADLGIAVARASDVAREAADIILLNSEVEAAVKSLALARATLRVIKQNLFWAFFYNALGVPLAALGFMSPVLCAAAMGVSDMIVIGNALRLKRWRF